MAFFLLLSFLLMLYASPALLIPALEAVRPAQLAGMGAIAVLATQKTLARSRWRYTWPEAYLVPWLIVGAGLSTMGAFWPGLAFDTTLDLAKIGVIYFLVLNCVDSEQRLRQTIAVLVVGGVFPAVGTIINFLTGNVEDGRAGWVGSYGNPNDLAYAMVILIPLAWQMIPKANWMMKPALFGVLTLYLAAILASRSRGGLIGAFVVILVLGVRRPGANAKFVTGVMLAGLLLAISVYWTRSEGFENLQSDFTLHQRLETIRAGWQMFLDHPLVGVGAGCSLLAWPLYAPADVDFRDALVIHNTPMQSLAELGIVGFVPLALLVGSAWKRSMATIRTAEYGSTAWTYAIALEASLLGYCVCSLSGAYLTSWFPYIVIGLISAVAMLPAEDRGVDAAHA